MIKSDIAFYLALGSNKQSKKVMDGVQNTALSKLKVGRYSSAMKDVVDKYYKICWDQLKSFIKRMSFEQFRTFLSAIEQSIYMKHHPSGRKTLDAILNQSMIPAGKPITPEQMDLAYESFSGMRNRSLALVIESYILFSTGSNSEVTKNTQHMMDVLWLSERVTELAKLSDTIHYLKGLDFFSILRTGKYDFKNKRKISKMVNRYQKQFALENRDIASYQGDSDSPEEIIKKMSDKFKKLDSFYAEIQGFTLTDSIKFLGNILSDKIDCFKQGEKAWVCTITEKAFLKRNKEKTGFTEKRLKKLLSFYSISSGKLRTTTFPNWRYPRDCTIYQQPLIQIAIHNERHICYTPNLIKQALGVQLSYPAGLIDRTHSDKISEKYKKKLTKAFEQEVAILLSECGFETITNIKSPPGEIDILAYFQDYGALLLVECKAPKVHLDIKQISSDIKKLNSWVVKLKKKRRYLESNLSDVRGAEKWVLKSRIKSIIVTQRPFPKDTESEYEVLHLIQLEDWITKFIQRFV